jgi:hypothetical protein
MLIYTLTDKHRESDLILKALVILNTTANPRKLRKWSCYLEDVRYDR